MAISDIPTLKRIQKNLHNIITSFEDNSPYFEYKNPSKKIELLSRPFILDNILNNLKDLYRRFSLEQKENFIDLLTDILFTYPTNNFIPNMPDISSLIVTNFISYKLDITLPPKLLTDIQYLQHPLEKENKTFILQILVFL